MPAEPVEAARHASRRSGRAASGGNGRLVRRIGRVAGQAGDAHHPVVLRVVRFERRVVDRPVLGDAVQRLDAEVRGMQAREMRRVQDGAAAHAVEVGDLDRRVVLVDRVVSSAACGCWGCSGSPSAGVTPSRARCSDSRLDCTQSPCSRHRMRMRVSARLQATAAPEAPAPMISTSTGSLIPRSGRWCARDAGRSARAAPGADGPAVPPRPARCPSRAGPAPPGGRPRTPASG